MFPLKENSIPLGYAVLCLFLSANSSVQASTKAAIKAPLIAQLASDTPPLQGTDRVSETREVLLRRHIRDFDSLVQPRHSDSAAERQIILRSYHEFLDVWLEGYPHRQDVQAMQELANHIYRDADNAKEFANKVESLFLEITGKPLQEQIGQLIAFLNTNTIPPLPELARQDRDRVEDRRRFLSQESERHKWNDLMTVVRGNPERYSANRELIRKFLRDNTETPFRAEADARISEIEQAWDQHGYDEIRNRLIAYQTGLPPTSVQLNALVSSLRNYRNRQDPTPRMRGYVNDWLLWYDTTDKANSVFIFVDRVEIEQRSYLDNRWDGSSMLRVRYSRRISTEEVAVRREDSEILTFDFKERLSGVPKLESIRLEVLSRWGWTRGLPDRVIKPSMSIVSLEVPLLYNDERTGVLYIRINGQPMLPDYTADR